MKPSDDPRCPFSPGYVPKINWLPMQKLADNGASVTRNLEKSRTADPLHDVKKGLAVSTEHRLLPKQFHIYARAGK